MELFGNTFFWTFFFMIGFIATLEIIEDLGPQFAARVLHRSVQTAWLVVLFVFSVIVFIRMLRLFGTTYTWTANALRNGVLIYVSFKFRNRHAFWTLLTLVFCTFWPFWDYNWLAAAGFAGTLLILVGLNRIRLWILASQWRLLTIVSVTSLIFWLFDMYSYRYQLPQTLLVVVCFILVMVIAYFYDRLLAYRKRRTNALTYDTQHDTLTEVYSVKKFNIDFNRYRQLVMAGQVPAVHLVMIDVDHFKRINDTYGHLVGDEVLKQFARHCVTYLNGTQFPCTLYRTGGEEFSIIIPGGATDEQVLKLIDDYRQTLSQFIIQTSGHTIQITISAGITQIISEDTHIKQAIKRADANLYDAKRSGRDRVAWDND